jgi:hypothetical protein
MEPMELEQLSTAEGLREVVKARWVDAQAAVSPRLERHYAALAKLAAALDDVDPDPAAYLGQVLRAKLRERATWLALVEMRQQVGLEFDQGCPPGTGFDWAAYDQVWSSPSTRSLTGIDASS